MKDFQQYFRYGILWWSVLPAEDIMTIVFNGSRTWSDDYDTETFVNEVMVR